MRFQPSIAYPILSLLLLLLVCPCNDLFGQRKDDPLSLFEESGSGVQARMVGVARKHISIYGGLSLPEGFYSAFMEDSPAGYANTGYAVGIDGSFPMFRNLGVAFTASHYANSIREEEYLTTLAHRLPTGTSGELTTDPWRHYFLAAGPYISLPEKKVTLELRTLIGATYANAPEISFEGQDAENNTVIDRREKASAFAPTFVFGGSVSYPIWQSWAAFIKADFIFASPKLNTTHVTQSDAGFLISSVERYNQSVNVFVIGLGTRFEFGYSKDQYIKVPDRPF